MRGPLDQQAPQVLRAQRDPLAHRVLRARLVLLELQVAQVFRDPLAHRGLKAFRGQQALRDQPEQTERKGHKV